MVKIYATAPNFPFPTFGSNNNSPFVRQKRIVESLKTKGFIVDSVSKPMSWADIINLGTHSPEYLHFLSCAYDSFQADNYHKDFKMLSNDGQELLTPCCISRFGVRENDRYPYRNIGCYTNDNLTPIFRGLSDSVRLAFSDAVFAASALRDENVVAAIPCHPGHHSGYNSFAGYCYLNNAVAAYVQAQHYGFKPALLDLDFHAGDGSDDISKRIFLPNVRSVHIDPSLDYPFYVSERFDNRLSFTGKCTLSHYLGLVSEAIMSFNNCDVLIIAFGSDTYSKDPEVSPQYQTQLDLDDYKLLASMIRNKWEGKKILVIQEGGYSDQTHIIFTNFFSCLC